MGVSPIRGKFLPFKVLCCLLYAETPWVVRDGQITEVLTGPAARAMRVSNGRLHEVLRELQTLGYLRIHAYPMGRVFCVVNPPPGLVRAEQGKSSNTHVGEPAIDWTPTTLTNSIEGPFRG